MIVRAFARTVLSAYPTQSLTRHPQIWQAMANSTSSRLHGHCICKSVTFTVPKPKDNPPILKFFCNCRDCQRSAGGPGQLVALYDKINVEINDEKGALAEYIIPGEATASGMPKPKLFCKNCGCTIGTVPGKWDGKRIVLRPILIEDDDKDAWKPTEEWFAKDKVNWMSLPDGLDSHEKGRPVK